MVKIFLLLYSFTLFAQMETIEITPKNYQEKLISILDAKRVTFKKKNSLKFTEISDLAYDKKKQLLYAISDRATLYTLKIEIKKDKIKKLKLLDAKKLRNRKKHLLSKNHTDAEGLDIVDNNLLISFEKEPDIKLFDKDAYCVKKYKLQKKLRNIKNYVSKNSALEAVTYSKKYGYITAPELPLKSSNRHRLYSQSREKWKFKVSGSITALQMLEDNKILIVERDFNTLTLSRTITLSLLDLQSSQLRQLLVMETSKGWRIDNIEGITEIDKNLFLLVSDDNDSLFQETQFILFRLIL